MVTWHAASINALGMWSAATPTRVTFPVAGRYRLRSRVGHHASAAGVRLASFYINGADAGLDRDRKEGSAADYISTEIESVVQASAGQWCEVGSYQNAGGLLNTRGDFAGEVNCDVEYLGPE